MVTFFFIFFVSSHHVVKSNGMTARNFISLLYIRILSAFVAVVFTCTVSDLMNVNPYHNGQ